MDIAYIGYLIFVIPGFTFVWTLRHFTKVGRLGEFEYAGWSLFAGIGMLYVYGLCIEFNTKISDWFGVNPNSDATINLSDPFALLGSLIGIGLGLTISLSFPLGYFAAYLSKKGLFAWVDNKLFSLLDKNWSR
jgi:hypothetical protein